MARQDIIDQVRALFDTYTAANNTLKAIAGVQAVGIGLVEEGDNVTDTVAYRVYVLQQTLDTGEIAYIDVDITEIPAVVEGAPTHVVGLPTGMSKTKIAQVDAAFKPYTRGPRPLLAGTQIRNAKLGDGAYGTLGCFATDNDPDSKYYRRKVILSNRHVLFQEVSMERSSNDLIGQPSISDWNCCVCGQIGQILRENDKYAERVTIDAAIALLDLEIEEENRTHNMASTDRILGAGELLWEGSKFRVAPGDAVWKDGCRTGLRTGIVVDVMFQDLEDGERSAQTNLGNIYDNLLIKPDNIDGIFGFSGDSGSCVFDSNNRVVGLYWRRATNWYGVACQIQNVMDELKIEILDSSADTSDTIPTRGTSLRAAKFAKSKAQPRSPYGRLRAALKKLKHGPMALAIVDAHQDEVLRLVNTNRACKAAWQRWEGPSFLAAFRRSSQNQKGPLPKTANNVSLPNFIIAMAAVLETHGSAEIAAAIRLQLPLVLEVIHEAQTFQDLLHALGQKKGKLA
jgi:hypothetical protein